MSRFIENTSNKLLLGLVLAAACLAAGAASAGPASTPASTPASAAASTSANATASSAAPLTRLGRSATPQEIAAWDIDVRPDFKGLPKGAGSVTAGQVVWEGKCASCHGTFGESNEVFTPIVGGTGPDDVKNGRVASLVNGRQPQKTTLMKVATVSTLWDYINRAMPWTAPKSLTHDEVYAVTAYILNMGEVVPDDFVLSDKTIAQAQARMPNRNGMQTRHGMWTVKGKPDVASVACMHDCLVQPEIRSSLPEASRNAHGNLALQTRGFGATRGVDTTQGAPAVKLALAGAGMQATPGKATPAQAVQVQAVQVHAAQAAPPKAAADGPVKALLAQSACMACHGIDTKVMGPSFAAIRDKYKGDAAAPARLAGKVRSGSTGTWGPMPMPAQGHLKDEDVKQMINWILAAPR